MKRWFLIHVYSGYEKKISSAIKQLCIEKKMENEIGEILVPTKTVSKLGKKGKITTEKKLYPGYIAICMEPKEELLNLISKMQGVMNFVGKDRTPQPLKEEEAERMLGITKGKQGKISEIPFTKGANVKIIDGPFSGFTGVVEEVSQERERVKLMVTIFGRQTPVELNFFQIEPI